MLKKGFTFVLALLLVLSILFPTVPAYSSDEQVVIIVDHLNVREGPGLTYDVMDEVKKGESYKILKKEDDWIKISLGDQAGWVAEWFVEQANVKAASSNQAIVTVDGLRVRKGPGLHFGINGYVNQDQYVDIIGSVEEWVNISTDHANGWVSKEYLKFIPSEETPVSTSDRTGTITTNRLNVRVEPSLKSTVIGKLNKGEEVTIQEVESDWVKIQYNGTKAWVSAQYVSIKEKEGSEVGNNKPDEEKQENVEQNPPQTEQLAIVTASSLNVREEGSLTAKIIDSVSKGEQVTIIEEKNKWHKVRFNNNQIGWVAGWFIEKSVEETNQSDSPDSTGEEEVVILYDGTNIRGGPSTTYPVVQRANQGQTFKILEKVGEWYEIEIAPQNQAYVAGWIVSAANADEPIEKPDETQYLADQTIVIDAGHGGRDDGTSGLSGTIEKKITIRTATLLAEKLNSAGARVIMTRSDDRYLSLRSRVSLSHYYNADAFISIHYDSFRDTSVNGITSYYYNSANRSLAQTIQSEMVSRTNLDDRGARYGNYFVIRENKEPAILLELGFLSNPIEEITIQTAEYQEQVTTAIYYGLAKYFKNSGY